MKTRQNYVLPASGPVSIDKLKFPSTMTNAELAKHEGFLQAMKQPSGSLQSVSSEV